MLKKSVLFFLLLLSLATFGFGLEDETAAREIVESTGQIPVLMYHHILPENQRAALPYNAAIISFESFKEQMGWLHNEGWQALSLNELYDLLAGQAPLPEKSFVITFDDGYASNLFFAFPTLNRYNFSAAEFVITANLEEETRKWNGKKLSWNDLKAISKLFSIQSHGHAFHQMQEGVPFLSTKTQDEIKEDLDFAWAEIDRHIDPGFRAFAYPYGIATETTMEVLRNQNVQLAFTTKEGYTTQDSDLLLIPRFSITPSMSIDAFKAIFQPIQIEESTSESKSDEQTPEQPEQNLDAIGEKYEQLEETE